MQRDALREEIKLRLTGGVLEIELDDNIVDKIIDSSLRELQRYICTPQFITIPFKRCIDLDELKDEFGHKIKISSISRLYRSESNIATNGSGTSFMDPMQASQWQLISGFGSVNNLQNYTYNLASWLTMLQIRNTLSTDLSWKFDKVDNKLYINISSGQPTGITIEYIPRYDTVEEIVSDYWIDTLVRLAVAKTKIAVGRIRTRYTQSNAVWAQDGAQILQEGLEEYKSLQEYLQANTQLVYGID